MSYEEKQSYNICGIHYEATLAEANKISMAVDRLPAYRDRVIAEEYMKMGHFDTKTPADREHLKESVEEFFMAQARACRAVHSLLVKEGILDE